MHTVRAGDPMRLRCALGLALLIAAGCGSGMTSAAAVGPEHDAGTLNGDAGAPDAGAPPSDAGQVDAGPADAGHPDAGQSDAGSPADGGTDGGAGGCAALLPSEAGDPVVVNLDLGDPSEICSAVQPDEGGTVPLRIATYDANGLHRTAWAFYRAADGARLRRQEWVGGLGPVSLLSQPDGFTGIELTGDAREIDLHNFTHAGEDVSVSHTLAREAEGAVVQDPTGGTVAFAVSFQGAGYSLEYRRFDAQGDLAATAIAATGSATQVSWVAGVSSGGDTLVVFGPPGQPCRALWLDRAGKAASAEFAPPTCRIHRFYPLLDGSLAVETSSLDASHSIAGAVAARSTRFAEAPAWLDGLSLREFFTLPAGGGYALREQGTGERFRLISGAGESCGELASPTLERGPVQIGRDGTLIEQDMNCTFRWFPRLFR